MDNKEIIVCPKCARNLYVPTGAGPGHVTCPSCRAVWEWSPETGSAPGTAPNSNFNQCKVCLTTLDVWKLLQKPRCPNCGAYCQPPNKLDEVLQAIFSPIHAEPDTRLVASPDAGITHSPSPVAKMKPGMMPHSDLPPDSQTAQKPSLVRRHPYLIGTVCLVVLLLLGFVGYKIVDYAFMPPERRLPENGHGVVNFDRTTTTSFLTVAPNIFDSNNIMVKVINANNQELVCSFVILSNKELEMKGQKPGLVRRFKTPIPSGTYHVRVARGLNWYGDEHTFGPYGTYREIVPAITIPERTDYVIELAGPLHGELGYKRINANEF